VLRGDRRRDLGAGVEVCRDEGQPQHEVGELRHAPAERGIHAEAIRVDEPRAAGKQGFKLLREGIDRRRALRRMGYDMEPDRCAQPALVAERDRSSMGILVMRVPKPFVFAGPGGASIMIGVIAELVH